MAQEEGEEMTILFKNGTETHLPDFSEWSVHKKLDNFYVKAGEHRYVFILHSIKAVTSDD